MNNLSKEKKQQIAFVAIITVVIAAGIWVGLVGSQKRNLDDARKKSAAAREKVEHAQNLIRQAEEVEQKLAETQAALALREETMASGDLYQWFVSRMITATSAQPVNFNQSSNPNLVDATILPKFPYRAAAYSVKLNGYYHDLGRFIADLENQFPYARVQNLDMTPMGGGGEKLNLNFEFVTLYHTNRAITIK